MIPAVWLMLGTLLYSLQLNVGSFPKPLSEAEEQHYLRLAREGDLNARNILIERNLRLVAPYYSHYQGAMGSYARRQQCANGL